MTCLRKDCELTLDGVVGGPEALGGQLEAAVDNHSHSCSQVPPFFLLNHAILSVMQIVLLESSLDRFSSCLLSFCLNFILNNRH